MNISFVKKYLQENLGFSAEKVDKIREISIKLIKNDLL